MVKQNVTTYFEWLEESPQKNTKITESTKQLDQTQRTEQLEDRRIKWHCSGRLWKNEKKIMKSTITLIDNISQFQKICTNVLGKKT